MWHGIALFPKNKSREKNRIHAKRPFKIVTTTSQPKQKAWQPLRNHLTSPTVNLTRQKRYIFKVLLFMRFHTCLKSTVLKISLEIKTEEPARLQRAKIYEKINMMGCCFWSHTVLWGRVFGERHNLLSSFQKFPCKMHKNSFDWALQLLTNETIQKMASLKTHMLHSGEANVREHRTQGPILTVELRGAQDWAATGSGGKTCGKENK